MHYEILKSQTYPLIYATDQWLGYRYIPNTDSRICVPGIEKRVRINSSGYYGPEFDRKKADGSYRVAFVGSSDASGVWLDGEDTFTDRLQRLCNVAGHHAEILNFSTDGAYRDLANLRLAESDVLDFDPDLIVLFVQVPMLPIVFYRDMYRGYVYIFGHSNQSPKELSESALSIRRRIDSLEKSKLGILYDASFIVRGFCRFYVLHRDDSLARTFTEYRRKRIQADNAIPMATVHGSLERIVLTRERARERGVELVLAQYSYNAVQDSAFAAQRLPCLFLGMPVDSGLENEYDGHINDAGHELMARRLFELLGDRWIARAESPLRAHHGNVPGPISLDLQTRPQSSSVSGR